MDITAVAFDFDQRWQRPLLVGLLMRQLDITPPADTMPKLSTIRRAGKACPGDFLHIQMCLSMTVIGPESVTAETATELLGTVMCTAVTPLYLSDDDMPIFGGIG